MQTTSSARTSVDDAIARAEREAEAATSALQRTRATILRVTQSFSRTSQRRGSVSGYAKLMEEAGRDDGRGSISLSLPRQAQLGASAASGTELDQLEGLALRASLQKEIEEEAAARRSLGSPGGKARRSSALAVGPAMELWNSIVGDGESAVSPRKLYSFATWLDVLLLYLASWFTLASGLCLPATLYFFSGTLNSVGQVREGPQLSSFRWFPTTGVSNSYTGID